MSEYPSVPPGSLLGGKFRIERLLGAGAMGTVYAIHHELTRHQRALKLLHPSVQQVPDLVRRFLNEASAAGRAGNPHLVETFDAGTLPTGEPYLVMELLQGETLGAMLERAGPLDPPLAAELVAQAAEGMEAAHRAGIIHRDLKPENLFVTRRSGVPFIKIMDFGVSKFATVSAGGMRSTRAGVTYGSPAYMSPEQLTGQLDIDGRTDVFALGVVLFECLTGERPFDADTIPALIVKILAGTLPPIESLRPGLPPELIEVVRRALAADREDRFPGARALEGALAPFRALPYVMPVSSMPAPLPPGARSGRWKLVLAGLAAMVGTGSLGVVLAHGRPPKTLPPAPSVSPVPVAIAPLADPVPVATLPTPSVEPPPVAPPPRPHAEVHKPAPPRTPPPTPSSAAENLGLRTDNPFR